MNVLRKDGVRQAFLYLANGYIATQTVEGDYPNYLGLIRKEHHLTATVDRHELAGAVEQAIPMTTERSPSCMLHLNEHFEIRAQHQDTGAVYVNEIPAELDGKEIRIHLTKPLPGPQHPPHHARRQHHHGNAQT